MTTETGAGQWGSALAFACNVFDLELEVYMVKVSYQQKPYRRNLMETYGSKVYASPTDRTNYGRSILAQDPDNPGSLGIAISEAVEAAATSNGAKKYGLGSVLGHVLLHQTVVGQEALKQMDLANEYPTWLSVAWWRFEFPGSRFRSCGNLKNGKRTRLGCGAHRFHLTKSVYTFDYGDTANGSVVKMHTLGHDFIRWHPCWRLALSRHGSTICLYDAGHIDAVAVKQIPTLDSAIQFARAEGIVPAPESAHAIRAAIDEALDAKTKGEKRVILFNLSGHGNFDMGAYEAYLSGKLEDYEYPAEAVQEAMKHLPQVPVA
jgi:tryptophan synthase beta chain